MAIRISPTMVCGYDFSICVSADGIVSSFGRDENGTHGHQSTKIISTPTPVSSVSSIIQIDSYGHTLCLDNNGISYSFGSNLFGELGIGKEKIFLLRAIGKSPIRNTSIPKNIDLNSIKQVSCGSCFTMCLSDDGILYSFGNNDKGQLG